ncbi:MAG: lytic transglycosylase F [Kiloniellales bacterium]|nr:lytic transglycosylase F [Kiloniellales bacterium]
MGKKGLQVLGLAGLAALLVGGACFAAFWPRETLSGAASSAGGGGAVETAAAVAPDAAAPETQTQPAGEAEARPESEPEAEDAILEHALDEWTGDFDGMVERGFVRLLTAYNPISFTYDGVEQKGLAVELARALEEHFQALSGRKRGDFQVVIIPLPRDDLLPFLLSGRGDVVAANLTITPERQAVVDFTDPTYPGVDELVVTGPAAPEVTSLDDLVATTLHVRRSSSYFGHLSALNQSRKAAGQPEVPIVLADENLEDYDLMEMVNVGLIPAVIVDSHKAALWGQVYEDIVVHENLAVHRGGNIAWALRKDSPKLLAALNGFVKTARKGTLLGNILIKRYLTTTKWIDNVRSGKARERYEATVAHIKEYAGQYDFDWLMITAQGYQESKLDQSKRSQAGAVGVMQVLPTTAADPNVGIADIDRVGPNVHAGVKYLRFLKDRYYSEPGISPLDQMLFTFAAYNAGPGNIAKARRKAAKMGLDPNRWFGQVEIAAARTISREPVVYVRNIYKYYVAYDRIAAIGEAKPSPVE